MPLFVSSLLNLWLLSATPGDSCRQALHHFVHGIEIYETLEGLKSSATESPEALVRSAILLSQRLQKDALAESLRSARAFSKELGIDILSTSWLYPQRRSVIDIKAWAALFRLDYVDDLIREAKGVAQRHELKVQISELKKLKAGNESLKTRLRNERNEKLRRYGFED